MSTYKKIFFLGIKGVAMSNLAIIFKKKGISVTGADVSEIFITDTLLRKHGIPIINGFDPLELPDDIDCFVYSAAHQGTNNPMAKAALSKKIPLIPQTECIADLMKDFKISIAISGCHGKTTTSSLLSYALIKLGKAPSYLIGSPEFAGYEGGDLAGHEYFIVEADEYGMNPPYDKRPKFHSLKPNNIICTNIDFDHPDVYDDLTMTQAAFKQFFDSTPLIVCGDDNNLMDVVKTLPDDQYITYGFDEQNDYRISGVSIKDGFMRFNINKKGISLGTYELSIFGNKNACNAAAVIAYLNEHGFPLDNIKHSVKYFSGAKRRFEHVYDNNSLMYFDDYAHHPHEIKATLMAAKLRFPGKRLIVIFQPHTYSRTQALLGEFTKALSLADMAYILPIFASARENEEVFSVTSGDIVNKSPATLRLATKDTIISELSENLRPNDLIMTMGAGDVYTLKNAIITVIDSKSKK